MALSFIGKPISLISHSDVRYRGILAGIDTAASTIQLSNVYSMGTEGRRPPNQFIAPVQDPYAYIIFRASEVKDLAVDEPIPAPPPQHNVRDDPAVIGVSGPAPTPYAPYPNAQQQQQQQPVNGVSPQPQHSQSVPVPTGAPAPASQSTQAIPAHAQAPAQAATRGGQGQTSSNANPNPRRNPLHTAAASLETVERALGDLRVSGGVQPNRGGRRGGHGAGGSRNGGSRPSDELKVPSTDFDFQSSNAKFEKPVHSPAGGAKAKETGDGESEESGEGAVEKEQTAYNPQKSFFDSLSSSAATPASGSGGQGGNQYRGGGGGGRRGGPGGGAGRNRREEEREKNVATFGEPGGVGLLGPGSYVGGWGGYGRRGGRPRRGGNGGGGRGGGPNNNGQPAVQARG